MIETVFFKEALKAQYVSLHRDWLGSEMHLALCVPSKVKYAQHSKSLDSDGTSSGSFEARLKWSDKTSHTLFSVYCHQSSFCLVDILVGEGELQGLSERMSKVKCL